jgi:hypothetical protein
VSVWRPIETAPRDGTSLLLYVPGVRTWNRPTDIADRVVGLWSLNFADEGRWISDIGDVDQGYESTGSYWVVEELQPTHWLALPDPPASPALPSQPRDSSPR